MQMLWIGCLESDIEFQNKAKKGYNLASAQISQQNLVKGIEQASGHVFDSINGSVLPPYPVYADKVIEPVVWSHAENARDISVGYKNRKYINRINCKKSMITAAKEWIETRYQGDGLIVFVYSMRSAPMATACYIKKRLKNVKVYLIVTDLPQYMDLGQNKLKSFLKKIDWQHIKRMQASIDGFILYAKKMADYLHIPDEKWFLMEGSYDANGFPYNSTEAKRKAIMYSGKLDEEYGVSMLLEAFMEIEDLDAELWLTGGGNAEDYINECAQRDNRIKFFGFLPCREDVLRLQQSAKALINMRLPSEPASAYCFPSKLFEYMASGVPVLSFILEGIPEEYYPYLFLVKNESKDALKEQLQKALEMQDDILWGEKARQFIVTKKNKEIQCKGIVDWIGKRNEFGF